MNYRWGGVTAIVLLLLFSLSFVSASAPFNHRYQGPDGQSSASYYNRNYNDGSGSYDSYGNYRYPIQRHATTPIFKGSYGNYRYQGYASGDVRPSYFFVDYPEFGARPYFSGGSGLGYGGFYGGGYGLGYGLGGGYYPGYSFNNYGISYYPTQYSYSYGGCSYGC